MNNRIQQRENGKKKAVAKIHKKDTENVVFVGRALPKQMMNQVKKAFTEFGNVQKIWFRTLVGFNEKKSLALQRKFKKEGREKTLMVGNFYIRYQSKEDAERAVQAMHMKEVEWHDDHLHVTMAEQKKYTRNAVHLRNLPPTATEKNVYEAFESMGVSGVRIFRDTETGDCLGTGFLEFDTAEACDLALQKKSVKIDRKPVYIHKVLKKKQLADQKAKKMIEVQKEERIKKRLGNVIVTKKNTPKKRIGALKKKKVPKQSRKKSIMK
ncbi:hypothetical protein FO519_000690 [Halicephalobus sp. NKZ332]|nr:hypothetical protein FO519_000690 [Halicephalobus sp. NKZ332]